MVTGDHPITAAAIAKQVTLFRKNIDSGDAIVVKGDNIREWTEIADPLNNKEVDAARPQTIAYRVSPAQCC